MLEPLGEAQLLLARAGEDERHARVDARPRAVRAVPPDEEHAEGEHARRVRGDAEDAQRQVRQVRAFVAHHGGVRAQKPLARVVALAVEERDRLLREQEVAPLEQEHARRLRALHRLGGVRLDQKAQRAFPHGNLALV